MQYSSSILIMAFAATNVLSHGVIDSVVGANGVTMPALSVIDGTPRDCASPACGAEADTSIIRANGPPLGKTNGAGPVSAAPMVALFMGGVANNTARELHAPTMMFRRGLFDKLTGGLGGAGAGAGAGAGGAAAGQTAAGTKTPSGTVENSVAAAAGAGSGSGLPTTADDGTLKMTFHQVNQDGAGPLTASVDPTSGGTSAAAFKSAQVTQNVPGLGIGGLSAAQTMDFPVAIQMPAGMTCSGTVSGVQNVCVAKLQNSALAGPFGGSVVFTQSAAAKKRAVEYNLAKRRFARALKATEDMA